MFVFETKELSRITGQTSTAVCSLARRLPLESQSEGVGVRRNFTRVDALVIVACRLLRLKGLPPAIATQIGVGLVAEFQKISKELELRSYLFAQPTGSHEWSYCITTDIEEAFDVLFDCPAAIAINVRNLYRDAKRELAKHDH